MNSGRMSLSASLSVGWWIAPSHHPKRRESSSTQQQRASCSGRSMISTTRWRWKEYSRNMWRSFLNALPVKHRGQCGSHTPHCVPPPFHAGHVTEQEGHKRKGKMTNKAAKICQKIRLPAAYFQLPRHVRCAAIAPYPCVKRSNSHDRASCGVGARLADISCNELIVTPFNFLERASLMMSGQRRLGIFPRRTQCATVLVATPVLEATKSRPPKFSMILCVLIKGMFMAFCHSVKRISANSVANSHKA
ncbi:MAG: hypothetical protein [Caudoviricetes sp.]|nr:MAG: hypothetical protein [Caudoviricetes sp.]